MSDTDENEVKELVAEDGRYVLYTGEDGEAIASDTTVSGSDQQ
jgi:hypothetical protein